MKSSTIPNVHPLTALMPLLKHVGFTLSAPADPKHPYTRLLVSESETSDTIEMVLLNEIAAASARQAKLKLEAGDPGLLRLILRLNLNLNPEQARVAPLVLMTANRFLAVGHWSLNDPDGVYLEDTLLFPQASPLPGVVMVELLEKLFLARKQQGALLERWVSGQASLLQTLAGLVSPEVQP